MSRRRLSRLRDLLFFYRSHRRQQRECRRRARSEKRLIVSGFTKLVGPAMVMEEPFHHGSIDRDVMQFAHYINWSLFGGNEGGKRLNLHAFNIEFDKNSLCRIRANCVFQKIDRNVDHTIVGLCRIEAAIDRFSAVERHRPAGAAKATASNLRVHMIDFEMFLDSFDIVGHRFADNELCRRITGRRSSRAQREEAYIASPINNEIRLEGLVKMVLVADREFESTLKVA